MNKITLPHDAVVFVGDGRKALFLRNAGDEKFFNLRTEQVFVDTNPPTIDPGVCLKGQEQTSAAALTRPIGTNWRSTASLAESLLR
jgi:protein required for attachment to host cells